ncbi:lytic transglycosylase domain-containing protein [Psychromicrobium sp. YIM B11713]|uniref:lytic transglycosylase domain-containing protein n=1 Tax=Psychromicrobium sp. YIM B11713 TaxID=3145233 RepID=UPI00374FC1FB
MKAVFSTLLAIAVVLPAGVWLATLQQASSHPVPTAIGASGMPGSGDPAAPDQSADISAAAPQASAGAQHKVLYVDQQWLQQISARTGISPRALKAYSQATLNQAWHSPACHLGWNTLAAIGYLESADATIGGKQLRPDGSASEKIIGPALDGEHFAKVLDTDGGALDGDRVFDRAIGPLQFLPATWAQYGKDGNGDGLADPQNIDDAAWSAAAYLCASGTDLRNAEAWNAAILAYNPSQDYLHSILQRADLYAELAR